MSEFRHKAQSGLSRVWLVVRLAVATAAFLAVLSFTFQNTEPLELDFLVWTFSVSEALIVFLAVVAGFLMGLGVSGWWQWRRRRVRVQKETARRSTEAEVTRSRDVNEEATRT